MDKGVSRRVRRWRALSIIHVIYQFVYQLRIYFFLINLLIVGRLTPVTR